MYDAAVEISAFLLLFYEEIHKQPINLLSFHPFHMLDMERILP